MQPFQLPDFYVPWPARQNPNLDIARAHSKMWARQIGILGQNHDKNSPEIWSEDSFDRHDYALFCSCIHPETPADELNLMTDWNVWAFYVDDYFLKVYKGPKNRDGAKEYLERILIFMPVDISPMPEPTTPTERGLADLWLRSAPSKSMDWRLRIIENTKSLLVESILELDSMLAQRLANPIEYIEMRRQVGGALWSADLVEHATFVEVPARVANTRPMQVIKNTFADAVHLRNDIFSYQREVIKEGELTNGVLVLERFLDIDTQQAVNLVNDLLTSRLQQFEHTALTELHQLFAEYQLDPNEQIQVLTYIRGLQDWQSGAHEWHIRTSRYLNPDIKKSDPVEDRLKTVEIGTKRLKNYAHTPYQKVAAPAYPNFYMPYSTHQNLHMERARWSSKAWARKMGMLEKLSVGREFFVWDDVRFDAADIAFFCALAYPGATEAELNMATQWLVWATYTDDFFAEVFGHDRDLTGARVWRARLWDCMPVESTSPVSTPTNPVERGLIDLWGKTTSRLPLNARQQFRKVVDGLFESWIWELGNRTQNRIPDMIDYVEMRRKTSGADFMLVFIRSVHGNGILPEIYNSRTLQELNNAAGDHVYLINDLVSYQKEIEFEGDLHNMVLVIQNFTGCDQNQAIAHVNNLMTARLKQFEYIVSFDLPRLFDDFQVDARSRAHVLSYVEELKHLMYASLEWHTQVMRYKEPQLRRIQQPSLGASLGLGTSAVRVLEDLAQRVPMAGLAPAAFLEADAPPIAEIPIVAGAFARSHQGPFFQKKENISFL